MKYTSEIHQFIAENVKGISTGDLVKMVNERFGIDFTDSKMKAYKANHKLKSGMPVGLPTGSPTSLFPEEIKEFIEQNHVGVGSKNMTNLVNKTFETNYTYAQIKSYYKNHSINSGLNGQFQKGQTPFNKGLKGVGGWEPTQFKKGHRPKNHLPVGSERINTMGYIDIKIAEPNKWRCKHQLIWIAANGEIPKGQVLIFGDGDRRNLDLDNLILISRRQLSTMNSKGLIQNNADLTRTGVIVANIYQKLSDRKKSK